MPGRGQVFQKPSTILFFPTSILLLTNISSCVLSNDLKKAKKKKEIEKTPWGKGYVLSSLKAKKSNFTQVCDFYLYTFSTLFRHIYHLWGGGKNNLH